MPVEVVFWPMQMHLVDCQCNWQTRKQNGCLSIEMKETPSATKRWSSQDAVATRETQRQRGRASVRDRDSRQLDATTTMRQIFPPATAAQKLMKMQMENDV